MGANKTSFKKGQVANPKGRPKKGYSITDWFKEMLSSKPEVKDAIGKKIIEKALKGDMAAMRLVWNYMDGMPSQAVKLGGDENNPLKLDVDINDMIGKAYGKIKQGDGTKSD